MQNGAVSAEDRLKPSILPMAEDSSQAFRIVRMTAVQWPASKKPWVLQSVEQVDGDEYVTLCTRDHGLRRFLGVGEKTLKSIVGDLRSLRSKAMAAIPSEAAASAASDSSLFDSQASSQKRTKRSAEDLPTSVQIALPAYGDVEAYAGKVQSSVHAQGRLSMHLEEGALKHLQGWARTFDRDAPTKKGVVSWIADRGCWVGRRTAQAKAEEGTQKRKYSTRSFRPEDDTDKAIEDARALAEAFADGEDEEPLGSDEGATSDSEPAAPEDSQG